MISVLLSRLVLLVFGTLYPAYASYKTVKTKNVRDYVKWMMYWIVFALYTFIEIFADIFIAFWFPFYYELKILFVLWLMCPATRGSTYIFRKVINPQLSKHEVMIDSYIASLWDHGYDFARKIGAQGVDYLVDIVLDLLRKGQANFLPKISDFAQRESVISNSNENSREQNYNVENAIDEEEFDLLMMEHPPMCNESSPASFSQKDTQNINSGSESDDIASVKNRPLRMSTRKTKVSSVKERKRKAK